MSSHEEHPVLIPSEGKLSLRQSPARGETGAIVMPEHAKQKPQTGRKKKKKKAKEVTAPVQAALAFFFVGGLLAALLFDQIAGTRVLSANHYIMVRLTLVFGAYVILLLEAFSHTMLHGVLCIFFPPYAVLYGLFFADGGASRGFTLALCVFLGAEAYLRPAKSFLSQANTAIEGVIHSVNSKISSASQEELKL